MQLNRKSVVGLLLIAILAISPICAFAQPLSPTPIYFTSGFDAEAEGIETTFQECRTIYGEAEAGTIVDVAVYKKDADGEYVEKYREELEVGSLGIFCSSIPLWMGRNYVEITAWAEDYEEVYYELTIKRLSEEVRQELKNMIALPLPIGGIC